MSVPFFECSSERLDQVIRPGMLCAFDFDGTLAPIVTEPHKAEVSLAILGRLHMLCASTPVAVITGRSLADVRARLDFAPGFVVGNHGLEGVPGREDCSAHYRETCLAWEQDLQAALAVLAARDATCAGIWVENKTYSLSVHYRLARDHGQAEAELAALFARLAPAPHIINGKCVFNLLPPGAANKGTAFDQLLRVSGAPTALYVGDDVTDEDIFRLQLPQLLSVRIERSPDSAAECYLDQQRDMVQLLDELIRRVDPRRT